VLNRTARSAILGLAAASLALPLIVRAQDDVDPRKPLWAYAITPNMAIANPEGLTPQPNWFASTAPPPGPPKATDLELQTLPGSKFQFTMAQIRSIREPVDWFPDDHPTVPDLVKFGKPPYARPCWSCHMLAGKGKPENAPLNGLPKDYIVRQLREFKNGSRDMADPRKPRDMRGIVKGMTEEDMEIAANFFAAVPQTPWIRVVEADTIPKVRMSGQKYNLDPAGGTEPIGVRIVEVSENAEHERLRSPRAGWVAYVPVGAIKKGEDLVKTGGGRTVPCISCHGQDLRGIASIPGIANRSPSYLGRQLYDFLTGKRRGEMAPMMVPVVEKLTPEDFVNILAYTASRPAPVAR
jgi:cytochrome c553